jgi:hypothetical protein
MASRAAAVALGLPRRVRERIQEFLLELIRADVSDREVEEARRVLTSPELYRLMKGGEPGEESEEQILTADRVQRSDQRHAAIARLLDPQMNIELIQRVLREKRSSTRARDPLSWPTLQPITRREGSDSSSRRGISRAGRARAVRRQWTIVIDSRLYSRHHTSYARTSSVTSGCTSTLAVRAQRRLHELLVGCERDPREDEADFFAHALIYGPRISATPRSPSSCARQRSTRSVSVYLEGDGRFRMPVVGESFCEGAFLELCRSPPTRRL